MKSMPEPKEAKSKAQQALALKEKYEAMIGEARDEQMGYIKSALAELESLGLKYHVLSDEEYEELSTPSPRFLQEVPKPKKQQKATVKTTNGRSAHFNPDKKCKTCNDMVGHDQRNHKTHPEIFTDEELEVRGLLPPDEPVQATLITT